MERARRQDAGFDVNQAAIRIDADCLERAKAQYDASRSSGGPASSAARKPAAQASHGKGATLSLHGHAAIKTTFLSCVCGRQGPWKRQAREECWQELRAAESEALGLVIMGLILLEEIEEELRRCTSLGDSLARFRFLRDAYHALFASRGLMMLGRSTFQRQ